MASDALYLALAQALSQPSKAYRAANAGLQGVGKGIQGYVTGNQIGEFLQNRNLDNKTLEDVFGDTLPPEVAGFKNLNVREAERLSKPIFAIGSLYRGKPRPPQPKPSRRQFVGTTGGNAVLFDPENPGTPFSTAPLPSQGGVIGPKTAPTLPAAQSEKTAELQKLIQDTDIIDKNYSDKFVGPYDAMKTAFQQRTGLGASAQAATFTEKLSGLRNYVLHLLSGAAITPQEAGRLMTQLPNERMSEVDFRTRLANFRNETESILKNRATEFQKSGYVGQNGFTPLPHGSQQNDSLGLFQ